MPFGFGLLLDEILISFNTIKLVFQYIYAFLIYYEKSWAASVLALRKKDAHVNFKRKEAIKVFLHDADNSDKTILSNLLSDML